MPQGNKVADAPLPRKAAKECVTTHLPNGLALKIDGAETRSLYFTLRVKKRLFGRERKL